jgi:hypothetical protein
LLRLIGKGATEGFANEVQIHYYWIVSDKRKPKMVEQVLTRQKENPEALKESDITYIPGIFDDNVEQTEHPNLPKEWLNTPVARLLAAHMKAIRKFKNMASNTSEPNSHVFVCMEDDVVLHKNFETIVRDVAKYCISQGKDNLLCISLGYVHPIGNTTSVSTLNNNVKINKITEMGNIIGRGTQCYMLNYAYVSKVLDAYEAEYKQQKEPQQDKIPSDHFLFNLPNTQQLLVEPPAVLEDYPTFGTLLNHTHNRDLYNQMVIKYNRGDYYSFLF